MAQVNLRRRCPVSGQINPCKHRNARNWSSTVEKVGAESMSVYGVPNLGTIEGREGYVLRA